MGFIQQIHLVIKDKEGVTSKVVDMLSLNEIGRASCRERVSSPV